MRRALPIVPLLLWTSVILGANKAESNVLVIGPLVRLVRAVDLRSICGTTAHVEACTSFAGQVLQARCEAAEGSWRIAATAQFVPVMHLTGLQHVAHEREHIADVEKAAAAHIEGLGKGIFDSAEGCEAASLDAVSRFTRDMDDFKRASNAMRHPKK